jgi:hypothetical protein
MAYKTGGYKTKFIEQYGYYTQVYTIYCAVESVTDTCMYKMFNDENQEVDISIAAEDDTEAFGKYSLIDCIYYLKQHKDKHYQYKEHDIIIEEMTQEEVNTIFG